MLSATLFLTSLPFFGVLAAEMPTLPADRFLPVASLPTQDSDLQINRLRSASKAVVLLNSTSGRCTASVVSLEGHLLTARHCLQSCLIQSGYFRATSEQNSVTYFVTDTTRTAPATCAIEIDGVPEKIVIEATSPGLVSKMDESGLGALNGALLRKLTGEGFTLRGDFVIARMLTSVPPAHCISLAPEAIHPDEAVETLGYPSASSRKDGFDSDGVQLYAAHGKMMSGIDDNACVQSQSPTAGRMAILRRSFDDPSGFMSSFDALEGSSGSPVLDQRGRIVGILTNVYRHAWSTQNSEDEPERRFCRGSARALSLNHILTMLKGREGLLSRLHCDAKP